MLIWVVAEASLLSGSGETVTRSPASAAEMFSRGGTQLGESAGGPGAELAEASATATATIAATAAASAEPANTVRPAAPLRPLAPLRDRVERAGARRVKL
jgi:hypothetical protein